MIREAIGIGETEELAKNDALKQLGVQNDNGVEFEIIKKAEKKRFGLFGGSPAKVKAFINIDEDIKESFTEEQNAKLKLYNDTMEKIEKKLKDKHLSKFNTLAEVIYMFSLSDKSKDNNFVK